MMITTVPKATRLSCRCCCSPEACEEGTLLARRHHLLRVRRVLWVRPDQLRSLRVQLLELREDHPFPVLHHPTGDGLPRPP